MSAEFIEPLYDTQAQKLVIGTEAIEQRLREEGGQDLIPLYHILTADLPINLQEFTVESVDNSQWTEQDVVNLGVWVVKVLKAHDPESDITRQHFGVLNLLGIAPSRRAIERLTKSPDFRSLKKRIHKEAEKEGFHFSIPWTNARAYAQARRLNLTLRRKLKPEDFDQEVAKAPSEGYAGWLISRKIGVGRLNEWLGYPDFEKWKTKDKYLDWGLKVVSANDDLELTPEILSFMAAEDRAPSEWLLRKYFGTWEKYRYELLRLVYAEKETREMRLQHYRDWGEELGLPQRIRELPREEFMKVAAMYQLVSYLVPELNGRLEPLAFLRLEQVIKNLTANYPELTTEDIIGEARLLGVYEDVASQRNDNENLRIRTMVENVIERGDLSIALRKVGLSTGVADELTRAILAINNPKAQVMALKNAQRMVNNLEAPSVSKTDNTLRTKIKTAPASRQAYGFLNQLLEIDVGDMGLTEVQVNQFLEPVFNETKKILGAQSLRGGAGLEHAWAHIQGETQREVGARRGSSRHAIRNARARTILKIKHQVAGPTVLRARFREVLSTEQQKKLDQLIRAAI